MPHFNYRALTPKGEVVSGAIVAPGLEEVARRIEYLGLVLIDADAGRQAPTISRATLAVLRQPRSEDVTIFTRDLALLLRAGARLDDGLELLANDTDIGRLRPTVAAIRTAVLSGESFAEALGRHPALFPVMYVALVRVGEAAGTLDHVLELLSVERQRAATLRRKLTDALQYPAFVLAAAVCVLVFFLMFVLPQFSAVLRDFGAKLDPAFAVFLDLSDAMRAHADAVGVAVLLALVGGSLLLRRPAVRTGLVNALSRLPVIRHVFDFYRTGLFCRNLGILLGSGLTLTGTLQILIDVMGATGGVADWTSMADRVRHGGKLSEALAASTMLPPTAVRMLRLGEETGQLAALATRVADFYEAKLQRSLDRMVGFAGPFAIVAIGIVVGGLIVSVMTALLSVSQAVG